MKKVVLIVPYFGKFPNYFPLFLNSCKNNQRYTWFIFTDNKEKYDYPENVKVINITFDELKNKIQNKFDFKISLKTPYKLCDFKPTYGYIFEDEIDSFDYWGHCDIDLIFGDLSKFLTEDILERYEKIFMWGHLTIYKNTNLNNRRFMEKLNGIEYYKKVFKNENNFIFDEGYQNSVNNIYFSLGIKCYEEICCADIYTKSSKFKLVKGFDRETKEYIVINHKKNFFVYDHGKVKEFYFENDEWLEKEYIYIHLQKRKMKVKKIADKDYYKIIPNEFSELEFDLTKKEKIKKYKINAHYLKIRFNNLLKKIKKIMKGI